jgi:DNA replication protein DnaC
MVDQTTCVTCGGGRDPEDRPGTVLAYGAARRLFFEHQAQGNCKRCASKKAQADLTEADLTQDRHLREQHEREQKQKREQKREQKRKRREKLWGELQERIGPELQELDPEHPDFDRAAYEKAQLWDGFQYFDAHKKRYFPTEEEKEKGDWESLGVNSLYLHGPAGCGKTRIAVFICRRECDNFEFVEFITEKELMDAVAAMANPATREASAELFARLSEGELLFFDDLGTASLTEARYSRLFELVDYRWKHRLRTVWTSNKSPKRIGAWVKRFWIKQGCDEEEAQTNTNKLLRRILGSTNKPLADVIECHCQS